MVFWTLFDWIQSSLKNWSQTTEINGVLLVFLEEEPFGVPQGSVLGPLFFLIYIYNDIQQIMGGFFHLYADDIIFIQHDSCPNKLVESFES